jgi:hypothetical protein
VDLNANVAGGPTVDFIIVGDVAHQDTVDKVLKMIASGNDLICVPVLVFDVRSELVAVSDLFLHDSLCPGVSLNELP